MIDAYSVPCKPDTRASTGPGLEPRITTTGIEVGASAPAGTSMKPVAFCPGPADAVPTLNPACPTATPERSTDSDASITQNCFMASPMLSMLLRPSHARLFLLCADGPTCGGGSNKS